MTHRSTTNPPHGGRRRKLRQATIERIDFEAKQAEARARWDGSTKQPARTLGNAKLVSALKATRKWSGTAAAAHMLVEYHGGGSHGPKIAAPLETDKELESKIRMIVQTYRLLDGSGLEREPLDSQLLQLAEFYVLDGRKDERSNPAQAEWREADRLELYESALKRTKPLPRKKLDAVILKLRLQLSNHPAAISKT